MSKSKQKGTAFETAVVRFLQENGFPHAERAPLSGNKDRGDITGTPGLVWECKNHKTLELAKWMNETLVETVNANADAGILVVKRRGQGDLRLQYAIVDLATMVWLLKEAGY